MENTRFLQAISESLKSILQAAICLHVKEPKWHVKDMAYLRVPCKSLGSQHLCLS